MIYTWTDGIYEAEVRDLHVECVRPTKLVAALYMV